MTSTITGWLHDPRSQRRWRALLVLLLAVTAWFAFTPRPPEFVPGGHDKLQHLLAFGALATTAALCGAGRLRQTTAAAAGLLVYGGFIEVVQSRLPPRHGDWADIAADAVGIAGGLLFAAALRRTIPPR